MRANTQTHCFNDCDWGGCPGHTVHTTYQTTSDILHIRREGPGKGIDLYLDPADIQTVLNTIAYHKDNIPGDLTPDPTKLTPATKSEQLNQ